MPKTILIPKKTFLAKVLVIVKCVTSPKPKKSKTPDFAFKSIIANFRASTDKSVLD